MMFDPAPFCRDMYKAMILAGLRAGISKAFVFNLAISSRALARASFDFCSGVGRLIFGAAFFVTFFLGLAFTTFFFALALATFFFAAGFFLETAFFFPALFVFATGCFLVAGFFVSFIVTTPSIDFFGDSVAYVRMAFDEMVWDILEAIYARWKDGSALYALDKLARL